MARARNIKPGFFKNEDLAECTPWARLCFAGLWCLADREGRLEDRPKRIKGELFPADTVDVEPLLQELQRWKFILRYEVDGLHAIQILKFKEHQTPHYSEKPSVIKAPSLQEFSPIKKPSDPDDSGNDDGMKRGSQPPDSLNPDSLNPDSGKKTARKRAPPAPVMDCPDDVEPQTWADWQQLRKAKRAPVTDTVLAEARREAGKARLTLERFLRIWCVRGSQGLQADWLKPNELGQGAAPAEPDWRREQRERMQQAAPYAAARRPQQSAFPDTEVTDALPHAPAR
ncbi:hypothetical protein [Xenophilus sp. Marseille-Q4582]|uniref:hypothetical protein n=1 Tax=Xenophilus sp. Marseille-Q4582 TaxID=2866600 RepID=UPI001CE474A4|nr:hypothetical protein [Xenophilus sp. Marseille-Q4582]